METTLEKVPQQFKSAKPMTNPKWIQFWEKWGIWLAIISLTIILFVFTDFGDFSRGMRDGYTDSGQKGPMSIGITIGVFVTALFGLGFVIAILSGIAHIYYTLFHKHFFKKNQIAYTILYIVCLLLIWNFMSDGLAKLKFFERYNGAVVKVEPSKYNETMTSVIASLLLIYMVVYAFITDFRKNRKVQLTLIQQRTQAELDALKAQVNPHFLFNSLNNIYGTAILEDSPRTAESIQQLSGLVRYVMEESQLQTTDIQRELRFIDDFVELQRIRLPNQDNIDIKTDIAWDEKPAQIVPLLLNPLIENAFKYGISIQYPCFVHIQLRVQEGTLHLTTENSVLARIDLEKGTGLGLANVRQRLALAYPDRHTLVVKEENDTFLVDLTIKL